MQTYKKNKIETMSNEMWADHNLTPGFNFEQLLNTLNIQLKEESLSDDLSAVLAIKNDKKLITLNSNNHPNRQRFSIAHEIGHLKLNHKISLDITKQTVIHHRDKISSTGTDTDEVEANYFAACLLMPSFQIEKHLKFDKSFDHNVVQISEIFKVSAASATLRLKNLGYI